MKKNNGKKSDELRAEYRREDLGQGKRGVLFEQYQAGTNLILLSPDVAAAFPSTQAVDKALRGLMQLAQRTAVAQAAKSDAPG